MENATRPIPPNQSEGCFNCGKGKNEILKSKLMRNASVALCVPCFELPQLPSTQPFNARQP